MATFTATRDFGFIKQETKWAVDPASTGSVSIQVKAGNGWKEIVVLDKDEDAGVLEGGMHIRAVVTGTVNYEVY
jgi:hypothetical protein